MALQSKLRNYALAFAATWEARAKLRRLIVTILLLLAGDIVGFPYLTIPTRSPYSVFLFGTLSYSASLLGFPIWDTYSVTLFGALGSTALLFGEEVL